MDFQDQILVVDDEEGIRLQMKWALGGSYQVHLAANEREALACLHDVQPNVVLLDISLSSSDEMGGLRLLDAILKTDPTIKVIMITGHDTRENALQAMDRGAFDFHAKPVDLDEIRVVIKRALYIQSIERENQALRLGSLPDLQSSIIGQSVQMQEVFQMIRRVATTDMTVLIQGESGTGKELVAREIHRLSNRTGRFVVVNCAAIPSELMESELFGHEKGAFTDAHTMKRGKIEEAHEGTLFLDEIAELPIELQVKLLRFLQEREIERVGGLDTIPIDTRVLAATNRDLEAEIERGTFREDLYYRLNVMDLHLPPLRERGEDIVLLANAYLLRYSKELGRNVKGFTPAALSSIRAHTWPGNVRELQNRIRKAVLITTGDRLTAEDLELAHTEEEVGSLDLQAAKDRIELEYLRRALTLHRGNISKSAHAIGVTRATFYDLIKKHQINVENFRNRRSN